MSASDGGSRLSSDTLAVFLEEISREPLLTPDEEVVTAKLVAAGDEDAKERMVLANLRLVVFWAKRYQHLGLTMLDLIQEGVFGLVRAVEKFEWRRGLKFSTYASWWIRQSLQRAVQQQAREIRVPGDVSDRSRRMELMRSDLESSLGRPPTDDELADTTGLTLDQVRQVNEAARVVASLDRPVGDEGDVSIGDLVIGDSGVEESVLVGLEKTEVRRALTALPEPHRTIIRRRYGFDGDPVGAYRLGRELGMSDRTVRRLEQEGIEMLSVRPGLAATA